MCFCKVMWEKARKEGHWKAVALVCVHTTPSLSLMSHSQDKQVVKHTKIIPQLSNLTAEGVKSTFSYSQVHLQEERQEGRPACNVLTFCLGRMSSGDSIGVSALQLEEFLFHSIGGWDCHQCPPPSPELHIPSLWPGKGPGPKVPSFRIT